MENELRRANTDVTKADKGVQLRDCHFLAQFVGNGDRTNWIWGVFRSRINRTFHQSELRTGIREKFESRIKFVFPVEK